MGKIKNNLTIAQEIVRLMERRDRLKPEMDALERNFLRGVISEETYNREMDRLIGEQCDG
jgi:hypothetical protein